MLINIITRKNVLLKIAVLALLMSGVAVVILMKNKKTVDGSWYFSDAIATNIMFPKPSKNEDKITFFTGSGVAEMDLSGFTTRSLTKEFILPKSKGAIWSQDGSKIFVKTEPITKSWYEIPDASYLTDNWWAINVSTNDIELLSCSNIDVSSPEDVFIEDNTPILLCDKENKNIKNGPNIITYENPSNIRILGKINNELLALSNGKIINLTNQNNNAFGDSIISAKIQNGVLYYFSQKDVGKNGEVWSTTELAGVPKLISNDFQSILFGEKDDRLVVIGRVKKEKLKNFEDKFGVEVEILEINNQLVQRYSVPEMSFQLDRAITLTGKGEKLVVITPNGIAFVGYQNESKAFETPPAKLVALDENSHIIDDGKISLNYSISDNSINSYISYYEPSAQIIKYSTESVIKYLSELGLDPNQINKQYHFVEYYDFE